MRGTRRPARAPRRRLRVRADAGPRGQGRRAGQGVQGTRGGRPRGVRDVAGEPGAPQARLPPPPGAAARGDAQAGEGRGDAEAGPAPGLERRGLPGASPQRQAVRGAPHATRAVPRALAHVPDPTVGVEVGALAVPEGSAPYAGRLQGGAAGARRAVAWGPPPRLARLAPEEAGERLGLWGARGGRRASTGGPGWARSASGGPTRAG